MLTAERLSPFRRSGRPLLPAERLTFSPLFTPSGSLARLLRPLVLSAHLLIAAIPPVHFVSSAVFLCIGRTFGNKQAPIASSLAMLSKQFFVNN